LIDLDTTAYLEERARALKCKREEDRLQHKAEMHSIEQQQQENYRTRGFRSSLICIFAYISANTGCLPFILGAYRIRGGPGGTFLWQRETWGVNLTAEALQSFLSRMVIKCGENIAGHEVLIH
jgi:hypothetical protein